MRIVVTLAVLIAAYALKLDNKLDTSPKYTISGDHILDNSHHDSKPGSPILPDWTDDQHRPILPPQNSEPWRKDLGMRLMKAASAHDAMEKCGSFMSMGDFSWCKRAMPEENNPAYKKQYRGMHDYEVRTDIKMADPPKADSLLALSFGIEEGDSWSEIMSGLYFVKTELFDCYYSGKKGPVVNDLHANHSVDKPCETRGCYTQEYHMHHVCVDDTSNVQGLFTDIHNRQYQSLSESLKGRAPLSTFVKLDVEGSEWAALERLLDNEEEMAKIRTLDMEVHFNRDPKVSEKDKTTNVIVLRDDPDQATLERHVAIMEKLATKFAVTGSTLEHYLGSLAKNFNATRGTDEHPREKEDPAYVVTENGLALDQYCISFVNRQLLS